jgi:hypothetical protein
MRESPLKYISNLINFLKTDIWRIRLDELPAKRSFLIRQIRIVILTFRGIDQDKCHLRASSLTFYSLLSIVPVLAMAFGIAKGFGASGAPGAHATIRTREERHPQSRTPRREKRAYLSCRKLDRPFLHTVRNEHAR